VARLSTLQSILQASAMGSPKILVLGGTGPAGICLLRELVYRSHTTVVYARNPSKIPKDLQENPLIEVDIPGFKILTLSIEIP
jgi:putative NADH-flavin reductase